MYDDSILISTKKMLGIASNYQEFDQDIITDINSVFMILNQLGVGPKETFSINDSSTKWSDFLSKEDDFNAVKSYMYLKVKMLFDPPLSSAVMQANTNLINELEWRLNANSESSKISGGES